jgi:hypothetical protein
VARNASAASQLSRLAQPLGADGIALSVNVGGELRGGGTMYFNAEGIKPTHPAQPLETAQRVANSLAEGQGYEATLTLTFENGRKGLGAALGQAEEGASSDVSVTGTFGPPGGGG